MTEEIPEGYDMTPMPEVSPGQTWSYDEGDDDGPMFSIILSADSEEPGCWNTFSYLRDHPHASAEVKMYMVEEDRERFTLLGGASE